MPPFDMTLVQRGARLRRSPFYEAEQRHGPRGYTDYNHMLFPTHYDDFETEYWHLLKHVTLWDVAGGGLDVEIREAEAHPLQIQGPKARDVVRALFGDEILDLKYYFLREAQV